MDFSTISSKRTMVRNYFLVGAVGGAVFSCVEYLIRLNTDDPQLFFPLLLRSMIMGSLIFGSIALFWLLSVNHFNQKTFLYSVLVRSVFYTLIATFWLALVNGAWFAIEGHHPALEELVHYLRDETYLINLASIFLVVIGTVSVSQINSLHTKGDLMNFVLGRYNRPKEVERIFCFIDLKGSTTIAERLGHFGFANFLKDYYSDITGALRKTNAQIYQYVGDEVVLSWSIKHGLENNNMINCFFEMKKTLFEMKQKYIAKYGVYPEFKAGMHRGNVIVTWVGELKKEIVYVGDVLNTTARIREDCSRLAKDFLVSEDLLHKLPGLGNIKASFVEETIPIGRHESIRLYSLENPE